MVGKGKRVEEWVEKEVDKGIDKRKDGGVEEEVEKENGASRDGWKVELAVSGELEDRI